jgi:hypothetical protein
METQNATILGLIVLAFGAAIKEFFAWVSKKIYKTQKQDLMV